jgi:hypothetical protein
LSSHVVHAIFATRRKKKSEIIQINENTQAMFFYGFTKSLIGSTDEKTKYLVRTCSSRTTLAIQIALYMGVARITYTYFLQRASKGKDNYRLSKRRGILERRRSGLHKNCCRAEREPVQRPEEDELEHKITPEELGKWLL